MQELLRGALATLLLLACAAPPPRAERLVALEQRASAQRARSQGVERELGQIETGAPPAPTGSTPSPYYEITTFRTREPLDARYEPMLRQELADALTRGGARALEYRGVDPPKRFDPPWASQQFQGLPIAALFATGNAAAPQFRGAEVDVRVALEPGPDRRVTAIHEVDGRIAAVDALAAEPAEPADGPPADALRARYGIGPVEGWNAQERASLEHALELLRPAERALLAGLPFRRKARDGFLPLGSSRHCGHFSLEQDQRRITVYDCAFGTDRFAFVGSLDRPIPPSVRVVLHEIGHAISGAQLGDVVAAVTVSQREMQQMVDEFNALGRSVAPDEAPRIEQLQGEIQEFQSDLVRWQQKLQGADQIGTPAVRAFMQVPGASSGFTSYGRTSPVEAFAEAFSLCRTDPEAGRRISSEVCAFFESDAYLESGN